MTLAAHHTHIQINEHVVSSPAATLQALLHRTHTVELFPHLCVARCHNHNSNINDYTTVTVFALASTSHTEHVGDASLFSCVSTSAPAAAAAVQQVVVVVALL